MTEKLHSILPVPSVGAEVELETGTGLGNKVPGHGATIFPRVMMTMASNNNLEDRLSFKTHVLAFTTPFLGMPP